MKEMSFEKALEKLENIVGELEKGDIPLDATLKKYEEGVALVRACQKKLDSARQKIDLLVRGKDGEFVKGDFEGAADEE